MVTPAAGAVVLVPFISRSTQQKATCPIHAGGSFSCQKAEMCYTYDRQLGPRQGGVAPGRDGSRAHHGGYGV